MIIILAGILDVVPSSARLSRFESTSRERALLQASWRRLRRSYGGARSREASPALGAGVQNSARHHQDASGAFT